LFQGRSRGKINRISAHSAAGGPCRRHWGANQVVISRRIVMAAVAMTVNGKAVTGDIDPRTLLVQFLREDLRLTGTHVGCDTSQCGACVVHVNGKAVKSCTVFAWQIDGAEVTTIEGLAAPNGPLHPMQEAFREHHGLQCGYCTPGMIMSAIDIVNRKGHELDDQTIRHELEGNLCRCTGYHNIVKAIAAGARAMGPNQGAGKQAAE
jgi:carbon-monoxide dehydrogenase small subunit